MDILDKKELTPSIVIPKSIQFFAKSIEKISPYLATLLSVRLFSTPLNFKRPNREQTMYDSAQKTFVNIPDIHKKIEVLSYGYSPKKVLLVHGWAGRSTQLFAFADKLLEKGYMVISFDGPGHGKSTGKRTNLLEFLEVLKVIQNDFGPFSAVVGHSFGAICSVNASATFLQTNCMVTIGGADKISKIMQRFTKSLTLSPKAGVRLQQYAERKWKLKADDFSTSLAAKKIKCPVLVIHDSLDGDVPVSCAYQIRLNLKNGSLLVTHGLGHTRILRNTEVVNKAVAFIEKHS